MKRKDEKEQVDVEEISGLKRKENAQNFGPSQPNLTQPELTLSP